MKVGLNLLKSMLWVAAEDAAPEYWVMRRFDFLIAALGDLRALLTCTALLVAVGVGDASASAQWGVLCSEVAGAASQKLYSRTAVEERR